MSTAVEDTSPLERVRCFLDHVEVDPGTLRRDRRGASWLSPAVQRLCEEDEACAAEVRSFVEQELELFGASDVGRDPFFTARVVEELPSPLRWTGLSPSRRVLLLATFHLVGGACACLVLAWLTPELLTSLAHTAHGWLSAAPQAGLDVAEFAGWGGLAAVAVVSVVAFATSKSHTSVA